MRKTMLADYDSSLEREKNVEVKSLEDYMAKNNLKGTKTKLGAYVVVDNPGDQTNKADSGKIATVMYRGYLQSNGKVFDTNMDTTKHHTDPINVSVGSRALSRVSVNVYLILVKEAKGNSYSCDAWLRTSRHRAQIFRFFKSYI
jgi:hypothetical protein